MIPIESARFQEKRDTDGPAFAYKLYKNIKIDHDLRGCQCGSPTIYASKEEAESGEGHLRFYTIGTGQDNNIRVLQRNDDPRWHCHCDKTSALFGNSTTQRKRRAETTEAELLAALEAREHPVLGETETGAATNLLKAGCYIIDRTVSATSQSTHAIKSVYGFISRISTNVKNMRNTLSQYYQRFRDAVSEPFFVVESRVQDPVTHNIIVKRIKRQHCLPINQSEPAVSTDKLHFYDWASDACYHIGGVKIVLKIMNPLMQQIVFLRRGFYDFDVDAIAKAPGLDSNMIDPMQGLSRSIHRLKEERREIMDDDDILAHLRRRQEAQEPPDRPDPVDNPYEADVVMEDWTSPGAVTDEIRFEEAAQVYLRGVEWAVRFMRDTYLDRNYLAKLKAAWPKPPRKLPVLGRYQKGLTVEIKRAADFLEFLVRNHIFFKIDAATLKVISKMIVDVNAVHKAEVPASWTVFPDHDDKMPGAFPLDEDEDAIEELRADELHVDPIYMVKHPELRDDHGDIANVADRKEILLPKPIRRDQDALYEYEHGQKRETGFGRRRRNRAVKAAEAPPEPFTKPIYKNFMDSRKPKLDGSDDTKKTVKFQSPMTRTAKPDRVPISRVLTPDEMAERRQAEEDGELRRRQLMASWRYGGKTPAEGEGERLGDADLQKRREAPKAAEEPHDDELPEINESRQRISADFEARFGDMKFLKSLKTDLDGLKRQPAPVVSAPVVSTAATIAAKTNSDVLRKLRQKTKERTAEERRQVLREWFDSMDLKDDPIEEDMNKIPRKQPQMIVDSQLGETLQRHLDNMERQRNEERIEAERREREAREAAERREREEREAAERRQGEQEATERQRQPRLSRRGLRRPEGNLITPLSAEWEQRVNETRRPNNPVVATAPTVGDLRVEDFWARLLDHGSWLNDNIVGGVLEHLGAFYKTGEGRHQDRKVAVCGSFFFGTIARIQDPARFGRPSRRQGITQENFLDHDVILLPICDGNHWTLGVVRPKRGTIAHVDSLEGGAGDARKIAVLRRWVEGLAGGRPGGWRQEDLACPRQTNGWDCGAFVVANAACLAAEVDPSAAYTRQQLALLRRRIAAVLLNGGFSGDLTLAGL